MLTERAHDVRIVVFESKAKIPYFVVKQTFITQVTAEYITRKQDALLFQIGTLCIWPMQIRCVQEFKRTITQANCVASSH